MRTMKNNWGTLVWSLDFARNDTICVCNQKQCPILLGSIFVENIQTYLGKKDQRLQDIIEQIELPEIKPTGNLFHDLMSCILEQQIHYRSTKKTFARLLEKAEIEELSLENFEIFEEKALEGFKMSMNKVETLGRVLGFFQHEQPVWENLEDKVIRKILSGIKGVGPWTQEMLLMYSLERKDIFPAQDYHLKLVMGNVYGIEAKVSQMKAIASEWIPYRSTAVRYLLAWKAAQKGKK
ncbi:MAG: hypothetical protein AAFR87_12950 [Bacteroidota bacterium]